MTFAELAKIQNQKGEVVKAVIDILLNADKKNFQLNELEALQFDASKYTAISVIAAHFRDRNVTDHAIEKCLEIYQANKNEMFHLRSNEALSAATNLAFYGASQKLIEKIAVILAEAGWCGRLKDLTRKLLDRALTATEVMALVDHYVNNTGSRAEHQEKELIRLAQIYAPEIRDEGVRKITAFVREFESHCD